MYVPGVVFERDWRRQEADVIVCAAPNAASACAHGANTWDCAHALRDRVDAVMRVAAGNGVDHLVLGAFGCGVFGNDPGMAAVWFRDWLRDHPGVFERVTFAIPGPGANNAEFRRVLE